MLPGAEREREREREGGGRERESMCICACVLFMSDVDDALVCTYFSLRI